MVMLAAARIVAKIREVLIVEIHPSKEMTT